MSSACPKQAGDEPDPLIWEGRPHAWFESRHIWALGATVCWLFIVTGGRPLYLAQPWWHSFVYTLALLGNGWALALFHSERYAIHRRSVRCRRGVFGAKEQSVPRAEVLRVEQIGSSVYFRLRSGDSLHFRCLQRPELALELWEQQEAP